MRLGPGLGSRCRSPEEWFVTPDLSEDLCDRVRTRPTDHPFPLRGYVSGLDPGPYRGSSRRPPETGLRTVLTPTGFGLIPGTGV